MNIINETLKKLDQLLKEEYLIERMSFDSSAVYGTLEASELESGTPTNKKIGKDSSCKYTFLRYDGYLFKIMINHLLNEIKFMIYDPKSKSFKVGEKIEDAKLNMQKFWAMFLFILKEMIKNSDYKFLTWATVEHTKKLYKTFFSNKYFLDLFKSMGYTYDESKTKEEGPNTIRYTFDKIKEQATSTEDLIKTYFAKLAELKKQIPSFVSAYDDITKNIKSYSDKELEEIINDIDSVLIKEASKTVITNRFKEGLYVKVVPTKESLKPILKEFKTKFPKISLDNDLHITVLYSTTDKPDTNAYQCEQIINKLNISYETTVKELTYWKGDNDNTYLVLLVDNSNLSQLHSYFTKAGYKDSHTQYKPHMTITNNFTIDDDFKYNIKLFNIKLSKANFIIKYSRCVLEKLES